MKNYLMLVGVCAVLCSCSTGDSAMSRILGGSSQAVTFLSLRTVSADEVEFVFSRPVKVKSVSFIPEIPVASAEGGERVLVKFGQIPEGGKLITADLVAEDEKKNTINVLVTFRARNNRMPQLVINELCTEYANAAAGKKSEFIEFKMLSAGNLGAMRVVIIGNSTASRETIYEFAPVEVKKDDYVVLHLRTFDPQSKDELGSSLSESGGINSSENARDFWVPGETKLIHKTSFVYVMDQDDKILAAVMLRENPGSPWPKEYFPEKADYLLLNGAWIGEAVPSSGTTNTRTICRDETLENSKTNADWYITATSSATPGGANNPKRYSN